MIPSDRMIPFFFLTFPPLGLAANALERIDGEVRLCSNFIGIFSNSGAFIRLVVALLLDQNDAWSTQLKLT
ncbi:MAG: transposase [Burkholderiales bacterium]|nr:transposase [Burkholderiales bacterium]